MPCLSPLVINSFVYWVGCWVGLCRQEKMGCFWNERVLTLRCGLIRVVFYIPKGYWPRWWGTSQLIPFTVHYLIDTITKHNTDKVYTSLRKDDCRDIYINQLIHQRCGHIVWSVNWWMNLLSDQLMLVSMDELINHIISF